MMDEACLSARSAAGQLRHAKLSLTADIYVGLKKRATGAAEVLEDLFQPCSARLSVRCLVDRSELILAQGLLALVGLLLQPGLNGFSAVSHVAAHPIADWTVALVPQAIQGVNGDAHSISDTSVSDISLSPAWSVMIISFLADRSSTQGSADSAWRPGAVAGGSGEPPGRAARHRGDADCQ